MTFYSPLFFLLLPLAVLAALIARGRDLTSGLKFSSEDLVKGLKPTLKVVMSDKMVYLRLAAAILMIFALARPRSPIAGSEIKNEGIDICLTIDSSTSMLAEDFTRNGRRESRLDAVKDVVAGFVRERPSDRMSLVTFAARAYTACPLTLDHSWLLANLERICPFGRE